MIIVIVLSRRTVSQVSEPGSSRSDSVASRLDQQVYRRASVGSYQSPALHACVFVVIAGVTGDGGVLLEPKRHYLDFLWTCWITSRTTS